MKYAEYDALPGVRASRLKLLAKSPLHYHAAEDSDTASRGMLRATHCLVLEPESFAREFTVFDGVRRGKVYDAVALANEGRTILNPREEDQARAVAAAILRHPIARTLFEGPGQSEHTIQWDHPYTGIKCKARLDRRIPGQIADIKTYGTTDERQVIRRVFDLRADLQMSHYREGVLVETGELCACLLVVAESAAPWDVAVFQLSTELLDHAGRERHALMETLKRCQEANDWPGRHQDIQTLELPTWMAEEEITGSEEEDPP